MGQEQAKIVGVDLEDMSGGLNSNSLSTTQIEDRDATNALNVYYHDGFLRTQFGTTRYNSTPNGVADSTTINGLHQYIQRDGTEFKVIVKGTSVYYDNSGTWADITGAVVVDNDQHQFIVFNDLVIGTSIGQAPWKWNGTGNIAALGGNPPKAKYATTFNGRAILANGDVGGTQLPTRVYFSEIDNPESWDTTDNFWEFDDDSGQAVTGVAPIGQNLAVYKEKSIGLVSGYGLSTWTVDRNFITGVGCAGGHTIAQAQMFVNNRFIMGHIFLGQDGVYFFNGSSVERLSDKIKPYIVGKNQLRFKNAVGKYLSSQEKYFVFFTSGGASANDVGFMYDVRKNGFWPIDSVRANSCAIMKDQSTGRNELFVGSNDGIVYKFNETTFERETATDLITNGDMELTTDWTDYNTPTTNARVNTTVYNNTYSRHIITDAADEGCYQDITTVVGSKYRVYAYINVVSGEAKITKMDTDGSNSSDSAEATAASWTRLTLSFTATSTTSRIVFRNTSTAVSEFFVDDASCRNIDFTCAWDSKWFDLGSSQDVKLLRELVAQVKTTGNYSIQVRTREDFATSAGTGGAFSVAGSGTYYGSGTYGGFTYGGETAKFGSVSQAMQNAFRFIQLRIATTKAQENFELERFTINAKPIGRRWI